MEKQHAYDKAMKSVKLGKKMEDLQKQKKDLLINANKLLADAQTEEKQDYPIVLLTEQDKIMEATYKQAEALDKEWTATRDAYKKLVNSAVGTENQMKKRN